jgi:hypothetical protein
MLKKIITLFLCFSIASCSTTPPHQNNPQTQKNNQFIGETVTDFLITQDGKKLIVIGNKHHFAFDLDNNLHEILLWPSRHKLSPSFYDLDSQSNNSASLTYNVSVKPNALSNEEIEFLKAHKFNEIFNGTNALLPPSYSLTNSLTGDFYNANGIIVDKSVRFKQPYFIKAKQAQFNLNTNAPSPVAVAGGSVLFLGLIIVAVPLMAIMKASGKCEPNSMCDSL